LIKVVLRASQTQADGSVLPLVEGQYDLVNMTHYLPTMFLPEII